MIENQKSDSKRVAKNTMMLYIRTILVMFVGLFTSRIILSVLGVEDYGTYNVVGGFVSFFSIISGTLVATTQRFITFELGRGSDCDYQKVFSAAMWIHIFLALVLLVLMETVGLWFLNTKMNIPADRIYAANWVFQFSILSFLVGIISTPYTAIIIAHERMKAFAYISVCDAVLRLLVVYVLYLFSYDKLIIYSILLFFVSFINRMVYNIYCKRNFSGAKLIMVKDKGIYKSMFSFAGMNFIGSFASIVANYGSDIVINIFFGVSLNAARGISNQVLHAVSKFVNDFTTALKPQITKEYANGNVEKSKLLCFQGAKYSFYMMMFFAIPIILRTPQILHLWLDEYPEYAVVFIRCSLLLALCSILSVTLITEILATGNLTNTTWWIGGIRLLTIPIIYICFTCGGTPAYAYYTLILIEIISLFVRLIILGNITSLNFLTDFMVYVFKPVSLSFLISAIALYLINNVLQNTIFGLLALVLISLIINVVVAFMVGMTKNERHTIKSFIRSRLLKI